METIQRKATRFINNEDACFFPSTYLAAKQLNWRFYFTGKKCKNQHIDIRYTSSKECRTCRINKNAKLINQQKEWTAKNKQRISLLGKQRYYANHERELERTRARYRDNPEKVKATNKAWWDKHPKIGNHYAAKRRARLLQATPSWADMEGIKRFYANCPPGYHVDHIHPLQGKTVCGFHVLENLQYLPASENQSKFNRFTPGHAV